jgi:hypothetical protein
MTAPLEATTAVAASRVLMEEVTREAVQEVVVSPETPRAAEALEAQAVTEGDTGEAAGKRREYAREKDTNL